MIPLPGEEVRQTLQGMIPLQVMTVERVHQIAMILLPVAMPVQVTLNMKTMNLLLFSHEGAERRTIGKVVMVEIRQVSLLHYNEVYYVFACRWCLEILVVGAGRDQV
jgi:hypothetical protein